MRDTADLSGDKYKKAGAVSSQYNLNMTDCPYTGRLPHIFFSKGWGRKVHSVTPN